MGNFSPCVPREKTNFQSLDQSTEFASSNSSTNAEMVNNYHEITNDDYDEKVIQIIDVLKDINKKPIKEVKMDPLTSVPISNKSFRVLSWQANKKIIATKTKFKCISDELWKEIQEDALVGPMKSKDGYLITIDYRDKKWCEKCIGCSWCGEILVPIETRFQAEQRQKCVMKEIKLLDELCTTYIHYFCCSTRCFQKFTQFMDSEKQIK